MKITNVRLRQLEGRLPYRGEFWENRLVRPIDVYPEHKAEPGLPLEYGRDEKGAYVLKAVFVHVETDEGLTGVFGPTNPPTAYFIATQIAPFIKGEDPTATERVWDKMYRHLIHSRKGHPMFAISAIDVALWDLKGKWLGKPVYRLLGGPVRDSIPAYASALGHSIEPDMVRKRVKSFVEQGYLATKWFFRRAPDDGEGRLLQSGARGRGGDEGDDEEGFWSHGRAVYPTW